MALIASLAVAGGVLGSARPQGPAGAFGALVPVRIAHVGRIEIDLRANDAGGLRRVSCARGSLATTSCFVVSRGN